MIKPGDTLLFDVELLGFHQKAKERWEMSAAELMEEATKTKVRYRILYTGRFVFYLVLRGVPLVEKRTAYGLVGLGPGVVCCVLSSWKERGELTLHMLYLQHASTVVIVK